MRKKGLISLICLQLCLMLFIPAAFAEEKKAPSVDLTPNAQSAVLMDADTGTVIAEKNKDAKLPPASITKIMTMLLIMEAVDKGNIKMDEKVKVSEYAASMGGSQIFLEPGEEMTVEEMLKGIAMASGNDASVAMAEKIAGSEENFVQMMNDRAQQLGMNNTHFSNCNGLPVANHYTTANDIAIMSRELLKHEVITKFTGAYQDYLRKETANPFWLVNTNKLVRFYNGADGLKTGYTSEAKFCLSATAKRENLRVVAVVLGEPNTKTRNAEVTKLFDYAFAQFTNYPLFKSGDSLGNFTINKGQVSTVPLVAKQNYSILMKKGSVTGEIRHELKLDPNIKAPIVLGQPIGRIIVYNGDNLLAEYPLESPVAVDKASWWKLFKRTTSNLFHTD
ncbi:D-alanyl-D-alanine carboxypeptidase (penicillin-binding protein 5/6) [Paenibacillus sp. V4I3]|uniref:D-alanyl-D-alanine carboxypeptidase family protein n=1 Tax=Paenibacillus sp. V4I3 TaxID=3042305 RepID=UPI00277E9FA7|nr:D-alanyl-D-alanine carboxypeptidase family protein [Paenibacillus sp. V4I3]MDQ0875054.1 D-alanyl-D-alanine carboxypeptidase (penicillin-binding protein 5/6) [Paenibacillus sp. V4I3]